MKRNDRETEREKPEKKEQREKVDWAAHYGLSDIPLCREVEGFIIGTSCYEKSVEVAIYRQPTNELEDGFSAIDLMFSGKLEITRSDDGAISSWRPLVNSVSMHHPNHFGPQRGLVIAEMIKTL